MGVKQLWSLLQGERILEKTQGANPEAHLDIVHEVDGKVIAVDLAMWMMQADQQQALLPHFSKEERCVKVAFERVCYKTQNVSTGAPLRSSGVCAVSA